jgi:carbon monoxide dehydrogenase subunit G
MRIEGNIVIERPAEEVFDFVADECNEPRFNPQMTQAEKISPGPIGVGTQFRAVITGAGEMTIEFTGYDRPRRLASTTHLSGMDITGVLFFEPVPEGTCMKWVWDMEPRGFYKFLGPVVRWMGERQEMMIWTGLKHVLEARERTSPQAATSADEGVRAAVSNRRPGLR